MILRDRLAMAEECIDILERLAGRAELGDVVVRGAVERHLHLAVEALRDVGMRMCSLLRLGRPEKYRDVAALLRRAGALDEELARRFELWIGFGNILVHGYAALDPAKLLEALREVGELRAIAARLAAFAGERGLDPPQDAGDVVEAVRRVLSARPYVVFAYLFGSRAGGTPVKGDVDVAVYTRGELGWRELVRLVEELEDAVGLPVDVLHLNTAPPVLAYQAAGGILLLDRDPERRAEYEARVVKEYLDLRPRLEEYYRRLFR